MRAVSPDDEYMHANTGERNFNESMYFNFYDPRARCGAFTRIGNRPNERYAELTIAVYQPDGTALFNYKRPAITDNRAFDAGGMRFDVVEPARHLTVRYDGHALYLARPLDLEDPRQAFTSNPFQPVSLELDWHGLSPLYGGEAAESTDMVFAKGHYEQHGRAVGTLTVNGVEQRVEGLGLRDHSWGPRSWQSPSYYRWLIGQFDSGFAFMGSQIVTQSGNELLSGFVFRDGRNDFVQRLEVHTDWKDPGRYHDQIDLTLHHGDEETRITGRVLTMLPLRNRREGKMTRISEGLTEWRCGDRVGYGWSEYLDQIS
jgi:hypothetical protein